MVEIDATIEEERVARAGLGLREAFLGKGNLIRFVIAFSIFLLQQWGGQNSVGCVLISSPLLVSNYKFQLLRASNLRLHWIHGHQELTSRIGDLRCCQGRCHCHLHLLRCRVPRPQVVAHHLLHRHGLPLLHHRRHPQDAPPGPKSYQPSTRISGHGRHALYLRLLLLHGLGSVFLPSRQATQAILTYLS